MTSKSAAKHKIARKPFCRQAHTMAASPSRQPRGEAMRDANGTRAKERGATLSMPVNQPPGLYHLSLGDFVVTAVNDGTYQADFNVIAGLDQRECERIETAGFRVVPPRMTMNSFLLQLDSRLALIDA